MSVSGGASAQLREEKSFSLIERLKRPALWLVVLLAMLVIIFRLLDIQTRWDSTILTLILNLVFVVVPSFFITVIAARSFMRTGVWPVLWLGIGVLTFGLAALLSNWLRITSSNNATTVYSIAALLAGIFHLFAGFFSLNRIPPMERRSARLFTLLQVYIVALSLTTLVTITGGQSLLPPFMVAGVGTLSRVIVQTTAASLFFLAGVMLFRESVRSKSDFIHWYSLGILLICLSMVGAMVGRIAGSPLSWTQRLAQYLGGSYLFIAALVTLRVARAQELPTDEAMASQFTRMEAKLKDSEERFFKAFHASPVPQTIARLPEGRWVEVNDSFLRMLGYTRSEVIGYTSAELNIIDPTERVRILQVVLESGSQQNVELNVQTKAGKPLTVLSSNEKIILNGQEHSISTLLDITDPKKAEAALRDSELRYRTVADKTYDFEFWINPEGKFIYASPSCERVYGFTPAHFMADPGLRRRIVYPEDIATFDRHVAEEAKRISGEVEYRILGSDGTHRWIGHACQPVFDEHGEFLGVRGSNRDITERKKAEEALKKLNEELENKVLQRTKDVTTERQRLFDVLETIPTMVCLLTPDYRVPFANKSFREKFGEANGRFCYEYCFRRKEPCEFCETYEVLKTGKPHHWEVVMFDGTSIDVHDFPFNDVDGTPMILEMDLDITERRKSEAALRQASQYTRSLIEASLDPLVTISSKGKITDVNEGTVSATGFSRQELINSDFSNYFTDPEKARAGYQQVFEKGYVTDYPLTIRHREGRSMDVLYNAMVYKDNSGNVLGVFAAARDVTERNQAEAALKALNETLEQRVTERTAELGDSEERFRALSETSPVGVGVSSADGMLLYANPSYELILGYGHGELIGIKASDLYWNPEGRRSWVSTMNDSGVVRNFETRLKRKDGTPIWVSISATPILYGGRQAVMGTIQDITARKKADELKDEFIGMVSHELKTPLTVMMGALHTATAKGVPEEEAKELVHEAINSTNTLASIVENPLELSRAQANRLDLHTEQSDVGKTAREVVQKLHGQSAIHRLIVDFPEGLPTVTVDPVRVERILFNLVENAIKYSPKGGEVRISAHKEDDKLVVCVSDQGPGISQEDQKKLFQSFEQLAVSNRRAMQGVGLGLKVCRTLVEAHGGRIWVESEPGNGSSFFFTIPRR